MGIFKIDVDIGFLENGKPVFPERLKFLVDTGATYTTLPSRVLQRLGVKPVGNMPVRLADGRIVEKPYSSVWLNIQGKPVGVTVLFGAEQDLPLLGATSLEQAGFGVDPEAKHLVPIQAIQA